MSQPRSALAPEVGTVSKKENRTFAADFSGEIDLDTINSITGTDVYSVVRGVTEPTDSIGISSPAIITADTVVNGITVPANKGVQFTARAKAISQNQKTYEVSVICGTVGGQTLEMKCPVRVES